MKVGNVVPQQKHAEKRLKNGCGHSDLMCGRSPRAVMSIDLQKHLKSPFSF